MDINQMFAKIKNGYQSSQNGKCKAYTDGFYYLPRNKKIMEEYKDDLIVLTGNLYGEVSKSCKSRRKA
jgi:DNA polymerase-3 subunit alpha